MSNIRILKKFIGADQIDGSKIKLSNEEWLRATDGSVDKNLLKYVKSANVDVVKIGAVPRMDDAQYEPVNAMDLASKAYVDGKASSGDSDLGNEATDRIGADNTLRAAIGDEVTARLGAEATLRADLGAEVTARIGADDTLRADLGVEVTARLGAEATLRADLGAEVTARIGADDTLRADLGNEVTARLGAEATLRADLGVEVTARLGAEQTLRDAIAKEASDRSAALNDLIGQAPGILEALGGISTALQDSDVTTGILNALAGEASLRMQGIGNEATARIGADDTLRADLGNEVTARLGAESTLRDDLGNEVTARLGAESTLRADLGAEVTARIGADDTLRADLGAEVTARIGADDTLRTEIDKLEGSNGSNFVGFMAAVSSDWDAGVDTVKEALDQIGADMTVAQGDITSLQSDVTDLLNGDAGLQSHKMTKVLNTQDVSAGYIDLDHTVKGDFLVVFAGRLALHKTADYTMSVVSGVTRLTWVNSVAAAGDEALVAGDAVYITYAYAPAV